MADDQIVNDAVGMVVGNVDVRSGPDAKGVLDTTGCDGVMIGRDIEGNPGIFRDAKGYLERGR